MTFNSLTFIAFFAIVALLHRLPFSWHTKKVNLLIASYVFYAAWNPPFILLLWASTFIDWKVAHWIDRTEDQARRKLVMLLSVVFNLGMLGYFKYGGFLLENFQALAATVGIDYTPPAWNIVLPIGISFYTFVTMSYTLDVYLRRARPGKSLPRLRAVRHLLPAPGRGPDPAPDRPAAAVRARVAADPPAAALGPDADDAGPVQEDRDRGRPARAGRRQGLRREGSVADARRVARHAGVLRPDLLRLRRLLDDGDRRVAGARLSLIDNFRYPYASIGFSDFWRRWHISLSTWLRDYLYVPLGGNRKGPGRTYVNLMLTMLLGGLWHGAAWTFVVWGGLHGLFLVGERCMKQAWGEFALWKSWPGRLLLGVLTYALVNITWVFFRAHDFHNAWRMLGSMLGFGPAGLPILTTWQVISAIVPVAAMLAIHIYMRERDLHVEVARWPVALVGLVLGAMLFLIAATQGGSSAFIYFQF